MSRPVWFALATEQRLTTRSPSTCETPPFPRTSPLRRTSPGPPSAGPPKISQQFSFFLPSLGGLLVEFWWCFEDQDPEMRTFGLSGCRVKPGPAALGPPRLHTTARELKTRTLKGPGASNTTKIPRQDPHRERKRTKMGTGEGKKARNFGPPPFRAPPPWTHPHYLAKFGLAKFVRSNNIGQMWSRPNSVSVWPNEVK